MRLVNRAIDAYGTSLLNYAHSLCRNNNVDADALFDDLFIYALKKFPEDKFMAYGFYRLKLYQLFVDRWRSERRRLDQPVAELPDREQPSSKEIVSEDAEIALRNRFFEDYPVDLTEIQKEALFLWARYGFTHQEIGEKLNIPRSTVADHIRIGRAAIVEYVNNQAFVKS